MTNDENESERELEGALREAARAYHAPPAVTPREAMWARIEAARAASRPDPDVIPIGRSPLRVERASQTTQHRTRPAWALSVAAALLLAAGIGVGRLTVTTSPVVGGGAGAEHAASTPSQVAAQPTDTALTTAGDPLRGGRSVASGPRGARGGDAADAASSAPLAYRLAAAEHLATTETLLATVSADARAGRADTSVAAWARDLLGTTRVLLDSPAARDPKMARLLEDLELVLAQVAQLPATGATRGAEELQAIDRAVRRHDVMTRVRAAIPEGPLPAGT